MDCSLCFFKRWTGGILHIEHETLRITFFSYSTSVIEVIYCLFFFTYSTIFSCFISTSIINYIISYITPSVF